MRPKPKNTVKQGSPSKVGTKARFNKEPSSRVQVPVRKELLTKKKKPIVGYMCKTDFDHELGNARNGNIVYPTIESLKEHRSCTAECGIVSVIVTLEEVIQKGTM